MKQRNNGEPRSSLKPNGEILPYSFVTIETSNADFNTLSTQVQDTVSFLKLHRDQLMQIKGTEGVEHINLDFGIEMTDGKFSEKIFLPIELISLAAELNMTVQLSIY
ncbi:hypothetical protein [Chitinophaga agri]|uniref:DUF4279 domain-containing protein n=1 Tax=Chitinophaga agri TaxID=2703787 RepID=A0A6B9ZPI7_9BACT|nr:hypothetical protein [Chitinophaga agri]QHS63551.1 hypothetical protein GWR21_29405 [Chitinophaga agri]